jgi:hypothetical protein
MKVVLRRRSLVDREVDESLVGHCDEVLPQIEEPKTGVEGNEVLGNGSNRDGRSIQSIDFQQGRHGSYWITPKG